MESVDDGWGCNDPLYTVGSRQLVLSRLLSHAERQERELTLLPLALPALNSLLKHKPPSGCLGRQTTGLYEEGSLCWSYSFVLVSSLHDQHVPNVVVKDANLRLWQTLFKEAEKAGEDQLKDGKNIILQSSLSDRHIPGTRIVSMTSFSEDLSPILVFIWPVLRSFFSLVTILESSAQLNHRDPRWISAQTVGKMSFNPVNNLIPCVIYVIIWKL